MEILMVWLDDIRPAPKGCTVCKSVNQTKSYILNHLRQNDFDKILIDLDHDLGDYHNDGGDVIKLLDWLEESNIVDERFFFRIHTANPVGRENMERVIRKNMWKQLL